MDDTDWAYLAGLLDGEGSFSLNGKIRYGKTGKPYNRFDARITVNQTTKPIIVWVSKIFTSNISFTQPNDFNKKGVYQVQTHKRQTIIFIINNILPYMRIKKAHAKLLLRYCLVRENKINKSKSLNSAKIGKQEMRIRDKLKILNGRGKGNT